MANTVKIRNSSTASAAPSSLEAGELAINTADGTLFWEDSAGAIQTTYLLPSFDDLSSTSHASTHATGGSDAIAPADIGAAPAASPAITGNATFTASSGVPLTVTNTGSGNSFVVEDAAGDTSPFVINADGNIVAGGNSRSIGTASRMTVSAENANWGVAIQAVCDSVGRGINIVSSDYSPNPDTGSLLYFNAASGGFTIGCLSPGNSASGFVNLAVSNLGINQTSPTSALDVNGVITVSAGSAAAPAIVASGDSNTGIAFPAADTVSISTNGVENVRVTSDGRLVVGAYTSAAIGGNYNNTNAELTVSSAKNAWGNLHIHDDQTAAAGVGGQIVMSGCFNGLSGSARYGIITAAKENSTQGDFKGYFTIQVNDGAGPQTRLRIDSSGNVGIGTTDPDSRLDVNGDVTISDKIVHSGDSNTAIRFPAADTFTIETDGVERVRVDSSGRLLVGATSGTFPLTVVANSSAQGIQIRGRSADGIADIWMTSNDGATRYGYISSRVNTLQFRPPSGAIIDFANHAGTASLLRVQDGGNVGIGATSPTAKLDINADTIRVRTAKTPASSSDTGNAGDICWDSSYLYICTATDTWRRIAHSTW